MIPPDLRKILEASGTRTVAGATHRAFELLEQSYAIRLPAELAEVLRLSNGLVAYGGHFRLFGLGPDCELDAILWNSADHWKFAWGADMECWWCFGENAWGDQYAYDVRQLNSGTPMVVLLHHVGMLPCLEPSPLQTVFHLESLHHERPDGFETMLRSRYPIVAVSQHLAYSPLYALLESGEQWNVDKIKLMDSRAAMIMNGDVSRQMARHGAVRLPQRAVPYADKKGRPRMRIIWKPPSAR